MIVKIPLIEDAMKASANVKLVANIASDFRNINWALNEKKDGILLRGPNTSYHDADPNLYDIVENYNCFDRRSINRFQSATKLYDLCFEDTWTLCSILRSNDPSTTRQLNIIHFDDHLDLMPTCWSLDEVKKLIKHSKSSGNGNINLEVINKIQSGEIGIGNFLTTLFFIYDEVNIIHIAPEVRQDFGVLNVCHENKTIPYCVDRSHVAIRFKDYDANKAVGSYVQVKDISSSLDLLNFGKAFLHIDLDYFSNDFNGGAKVTPTTENETKELILRFQNFIKELQRKQVKLSGTCVATSPGFCSSIKWKKLLRVVDESMLDFQSK